MFLSGEFSKISRVSKRLLHYYDDIGLLKPAHIDEENGYRYYSAKQLSDLNRILALKDLGLTLDQIKKMLDKALSDDEIQVLASAVKHRNTCLYDNGDPSRPIMEELEELLYSVQST